MEFWQSKTLLRSINHAIINRRRVLAYTIIDNNIVYVPRRGVVDEQLCYDLGYDVYESQHGGGVIVANKGDIDIAYFGKTRNGFSQSFIEAFVAWLKKKGLNAEYYDNDILVDGYKVCGVGTRTHGDIDYTVVHVGINTNLDHIRRICTKPMKKVPKGLGDYGITAEDIKAVLAEVEGVYNENY